MPTTRNGATMADPIAFETVGLALRLQTSGDTELVTARGELDVSTAPLMATVLEAALLIDHRLVVLDAARITFIDAAGLGSIVEIAHHHPVGAVVLRSPSPPVMRVLRLAGRAGTVRTPADLPSLPLTTKAELRADQVARPPFGDRLCAPREALVRLHVTSGTTGEPVAIGLTAADHAANSAIGGAAFAIAGVRRTVAYEVADLSLTVDFVRYGLAVAIVPPTWADAEGVAMVPLRPPAPEFTISIAAPADRELGAAALQPVWTERTQPGRLNGERLRALAIAAEPPDCLVNP